MVHGLDRERFGIYYIIYNILYIYIYFFRCIVPAKTAHGVEVRRKSSLQPESSCRRPGEHKDPCERAEKRATFKSSPFCPQ